MRIIKRYSNRKLYDTETKQYITLEQIADLVREGIELQVVDNTAGEDLTALTLSQIILEQEKKQKGFLPRSVLNALVEAGGKPISSLRQHLESPLGFIKQVDLEIERRIQTLIQRGEIAEEHGRKLRNQLLENSSILGFSNTPKDEDIEQILKKRDIPTNDDLQNLITQLETLSQKIDELE
jgi:polyhydroxyalkanoate synthesis repressor PhaR